ncbi:MAG: family transporter, partial [Paenibacillus sp.]|nr:family transporter [Paenibacillus sp.]
MDNDTVWTERFRRLILNNRFVLGLLVLLLIGLNIRIFSTIPYVFLPFVALVKTIFLPIL